MIFISLSVLFCIVVCNAFRLSNPGQKIETKSVRAIFKTCGYEKQNSSCSDQLEIKTWLEPNSSGEFFLVLDAYDPKEKIRLPLLHPYLIQISNKAQLASYPLKLRENMEVKCDTRNGKVPGDLILLLNSPESSTPVPNNLTSFLSKSNKIKIEFRAKENRQPPTSWRDNSDKSQGSHQPNVSSSSSHHHQKRFGLSNHQRACSEPTDNEDDPNLLVQSLGKNQRNTQGKKSKNFRFENEDEKEEMSEHNNIQR